MVKGDLPPLVLGVLFFSTFAIPWLILLVGYNRISEDVATKYTRYVLQRVHRGAYLAGSGGQKGLQGILTRVETQPPVRGADRYGGVGPAVKLRHIIKE